MTEDKDNNVNQWLFLEQELKDICNFYIDVLYGIIIQKVVFGSRRLWRDNMGYIYAENLNRIGRVDSDGYIYAENLKRLGRIKSDGYIYGENLNCIGHIDSDGFIYLSNMKRIGRIHRDGYVYDELFNRVGKLDGDIVGFIFNGSNGSNKDSTSTQSANVSSESPVYGGGFTSNAQSGFIGIFLGIVIGIATSSFLRGILAMFIVSMGLDLFREYLSPLNKFGTIVVEIVMIIIFVWSFF